ncbi:MAG: hypothetical protein F6K03_14500 [Kamptonema sp. SIO4C4]|nr:hypothetical protein [Kamptonema sp. SIO4C4]
MNVQRDRASTVVEITSEQRWSIYQRLQELGLPCHCQAYQPLQVELSDTHAILQFWQVCRHLYASLPELRHWLESCWQLPASAQEGE